MIPLEIKNLIKTYKMKSGAEVQAVKDVSFNVEPGEIFGLLGPNGAGKTTIISNITTLESPTSGQVMVFGQSVQKNPRYTKQQVGVVQQEIVNQGFFSLEELLQFHSGYYGIWNNKNRIEFLLNRLGLYEHRKKMVKQLSGGMKRRMMIAKALVHTPKLLLLDEPTAGVDIELRTSLWEFVRELRKEGMSILLTTHYLQEAEELCDRVGIINKGELQYVGETKGIIQQLTKRTVDLTLQAEDTSRCENEFKKSPYFIKSYNHTFSFSVPHQVNVGELLAGLKVQITQIQDVKTREGSLEEAFMSVLKAGK